jgi:outer membrane protein OmpA-like peptidoglycan-associated protein
MKTLIPVFLMLIVIQGRLAFGQDAVKKRMPLFVSHLSEENKAILRRKGAPKHFFLTKLICFKAKCRGFIGWRKNQRGHRFKGYKDGGKVPRKPANKPVIEKDTVVIAENIATPPQNDIASANAKQEQRFVLDEVLFEVNSAHLNEHFTYRLDSLVEILMVDERLVAKISGHTDNTGNESRNSKLSLARASAVADYLVKNNISQQRISFEGLGSSRPIASNQTGEGRRKNRRVEIILSAH